MDNNIELPEFDEREIEVNRDFDDLEDTKDYSNLVEEVGIEDDK